MHSSDCSRVRCSHGGTHSQQRQLFIQALQITKRSRQRVKQRSSEVDQKATSSEYSAKLTQTIYTKGAHSLSDDELKLLTSIKNGKGKELIDMAQNADGNNWSYDPYWDDPEGGYQGYGEACRRTTYEAIIAQQKVVTQTGNTLRDDIDVQESTSESSGSKSLASIDWGSWVQGTTATATLNDPKDVQNDPKNVQNDPESSTHMADSDPISHAEWQLVEGCMLRVPQTSGGQFILGQAVQLDQHGNQTPVKIEIDYKSGEPRGGGAVQGAVSSEQGTEDAGDTTSGVRGCDNARDSAGDVEVDFDAGVVGNVAQYYVSIAWEEQSDADVLDGDTQAMTQVRDLFFVPCAKPSTELFAIDTQATQVHNEHLYKYSSESNTLSKCEVRDNSTSEEVYLRIRPNLDQYSIEDVSSIKSPEIMAARVQEEYWEAMAELNNPARDTNLLVESGEDDVEDAVQGLFEEDEEEYEDEEDADNEM